MLSDRRDYAGGSGTKKQWNDLFTFGSAALAGFAMELLAVAVTDIYYYNPGFWLNIGTEPKQFPVFGGFMWGGLTVYGMRLAEKLGFGKKLTALCVGMMIVTMDILLDVVAIRLDGGFWTWVGQPISLDITQSAFMSVIWVNFLGYMIETPAVTLLTLYKRERVAETDWKKQFVSMLLITLGGIVITGAGSLVALGLNALTNDWFSCIVFLLIWLSMAGAIAVRAVRRRMRLAPARCWNWPMLIFWAAMYGYCLIALAALGVAVSHPWFVLLGVGFAAATLFFCLAEPVGRGREE